MATNGHPATPPPNDQPAKPAESAAAPASAPAPTPTPTSATAPAPTPAPAPAPAPTPTASTRPAHPDPDPEVPLTSASDDGTSKRPRDARVVHMVLSSMSIQSYQERVPLQLLDFAYRYTSGILNDSLRLSAEGYANQSSGGGGRKGAQDDGEKITVTALRQAISSRQGYAFSNPLSKEFMMEQALQRNQIQLPKVERAYGVQLPPEKYCLTGVGWGLRDEWESDEDDDAMVVDAPAMLRTASSQQRKEDAEMGGMDADEDEEGAGRMEDVFGEEDTTMAQD